MIMGSLAKSERCRLKSSDPCETSITEACLERHVATIRNRLCLSFSLEFVRTLLSQDEDGDQFMARQSVLAVNQSWRGVDGGSGI